MWAFGPLDSGAPGYHNSNRGLSQSMKMIDVAPNAPLLPSGKADVWTSWMPLPADGSIDFFSERSFDSAATATSSWIGIGFSPPTAAVRASVRASSCACALDAAGGPFLLVQWVLRVGGVA